MRHHIHHAFIFTQMPGCSAVFLYSPDRLMPRHAKTHLDPAIQDKAWGKATWAFALWQDQFNQLRHGVL